MIAEKLAEYLEEKIPALKVAKHIFINFMPSDIATGVLIKPGFSGFEIDPELIGLHRGTFNVVVRGKSYLNVEASMNEISAVLTVAGLQLGEVLFHSIRPKNTPLSYQLSLGDNFEFSVNFFTIYAIVA